MESKFDAPFIFKLSFYNPSEKNSARNAAHIHYIGTRPGADLGEVENPKEDELNLDEESKPNTAAGHVKYAHERPGSHGLFSSSSSSPDLKAIQNELKEHKGVVWRSVLSLKEVDAIRLGFTKRERWEEALRASVPQVAKKMGIDNLNLRWVAAFHEEQGHPHVHLVMWEKEPARTKGLLSKGEREDVKNVFMGQIYADERTRVLQERTAMRNLIQDFAKEDTEKAVSLVEEAKRESKSVQLEMEATGLSVVNIAPKMYPENIQEYSSKLNKLAAKMPGKGRAMLKFMPEDVKEEALNIAEHLIKQPAFKESLDRYMQAVEDTTKFHTHDLSAIQRSKEKAFDDLKNRVANVVIRGAAQVNRIDQQHEYQVQNKQQASASVARGIWKSVWNSIEQVRMQSEAQGEIQKRQAEKQQKKVRKQQQSQENERD